MTEYALEYKSGDSDDIGSILYENEAAVDLTGLSVSFVMKSDDGLRVVVPCSLGGIVAGANVPATAGGVTVHFSGTSTATTGHYSGEFIVSWNSTGKVRYPSGNNYLSVMIWEAI